MKQLVLIISLFAIISCSERFEPNFEKYRADVQFVITEEAMDEVKSFPSFQIKVTNVEKNYSFVQVCDTNGLIQLESLESGKYKFEGSFQIPKDGYNINLHAHSDTFIVEDCYCYFPIEVIYSQTNGGGFVIREYYYNGSLTPTDQNYSSDQFIEVYNNGEDTLYADSILLVELEGYGITESSFKYMMADSIVVKTIWAVPGTGYDYPIAPGDGYIMARDPFNHQSDPNGNPNSPVDLGNADFDFWSDKTADKDIDFPAPNMVEKLWVYKGTDMVFHTRGGSPIALVKIPGDVDQYISNNYVTEETTTTVRYYCKIPNEWVVDAVEVKRGDKDLFKRFDSSLDVGSVEIEADTYSGYSIRRKIDKKINGRTVYKDTNNSAEDFDHDVTPQPGFYD